MNDAVMQLFEFLLTLAGIQQLSQFFVSLHELDQSIKNILSVVGGFTIVIGVLQCFFGYKLFKLWCACIGFLVGGIIGMTLYASGLITGSILIDVIGMIIVISLCFVGAFIAYKAYLVGVFIYSFVAAFLVGFIVMGLITDSMNTGLITGLIAGVAMGVIAVIFQRFWIIAATSVSGGIAIGTSLMMILQNTDSVWNYILPPLFIIAGFIVQHNTVKKSHPARSDIRTVPAHPSQQPPVYLDAEEQRKRENPEPDNTPQESAEDK